MKKLFYILLLLVTGTILGQTNPFPSLISVSIGVPKSEVVIATTSTSPTWSPQAITNTGEILKWQVTGGVEIAEQTINDPTFDLSTNTGEAIIHIRTNSEFTGFTQLSANDLSITSVTGVVLPDMEDFSIKQNGSLASLNVTRMPKVWRYTIRDNNLSTIDLSNNPLLTNLYIYGNKLTDLNIDNNPNLQNVSVSNNNLSTTTLDYLINTLDSFGVLNGHLDLNNNIGNPSIVSYAAWQNLEAKGWTFDQTHPSAIPEQPPLTTTAVLSNFHINDGEPTKVYFDASSDVSTMTDIGFNITSNTITGLTVNPGGLSGYFTVGTPFTFWSNNTIRLGENSSTTDAQSILHNFTLQYIVNYISEPTTANVKYVDSAGTGDGTLITTPMSLADAFLESAANTTYYVKARDYGSANYVIANGGNATNPVIFEGYEIDPEDSPSHIFTNNVVLSSTKMPLISSGAITGIGISSGSNDYIIMRNFQVSGYLSCFQFGGSNYSIIENCYAQDAFEKGFNLWANGGSMNVRILNSHAQNVREGFYNRGHGNLLEGNYACSNFTTADMDYYFLTVASSLGDGHHILRNNIADRIDGDSHPGHGFDLKQQHEPSVLEYCLVENCTGYSIGQTMSFRHPGSRFNVGRNIQAYGDRSEGNLVTFRDGASYNIIENSYAEDIQEAIKLRNKQSEQGIQPGGHYNKVINCVVNGANWIMTESIILPGTAGVMPPSTYNEIIHSTFSNIANGVFSSANETGLGATNTIRNSIFDNVANSMVGTFVPVMESNIIFSNTSLSSYVGSNGNVSLDPVLDVNLVPTATLASVEVSSLAMVPYDHNKSQRATPETTAGAKKHFNEIIEADITAPTLLSATIGSSSPANVVMVFDESVTMTNLGFTISGTTATLFASVSGSGTTWTGVLASPAINGEVITLSYNSVPGDVKDGSGNDLASVTNRPVTNEVATAIAYFFNGSANSYLGLDQSTMLDGIVSQTWIVKAKITGDNTLAKGILGSSNDNDLQWEVEVDNLLDIRLNDTGTTVLRNVTWSQDETYHVFAFVYDSATGVSIYEDGILVGSNSDVLFTGRIAGLTARFGYANGFTLIGEITDIQFYNRNLTPTEVSNLNTDLTDLPTDHATSLVANFAGNKTGTTWTSEVGGFTATNAGSVTLN